jgi:hypothetical protein
MRTLLPFVLFLLLVGVAMFGCSSKSSGPPPAATDVTLKVPGMN